MSAHQGEAVVRPTEQNIVRDRICQFSSIRGDFDDHCDILFRAFLIGSGVTMDARVTTTIDGESQSAGRSKHHASTTKEQAKRCNNSRAYSQAMALFQ
jgi:hypothetical protein